MAEVDQKWHFEKTVNVGHIITTVILMVSAFWFISDLQQGVKNNTQALTYMQERHEIDMKRVDSQRDEDIKRVEKRLDKIEAKIDRLLTQIQ